MEETTETILLEGFVEGCTHDWCDTKECGCEGSVCNDCLAVREVEHGDAE